MRRAKFFVLTNNVNWERSRNRMTQRRIAVKIKGTEDFVACQKAVGISKFVAITKFSNIFAKAKLYFLSRCEQVQFFVDVYYVATKQQRKIVGCQSG